MSCLSLTVSQQEKLNTGACEKLLLLAPRCHIPGRTHSSWGLSQDLTAALSKRVAVGSVSIPACGF